MPRAVECIGATVTSDGYPSFRFLCDCSTVVDVVVADLAERSGTDVLEFAFTCDGCESSHWLTVERQHSGEAGSAPPN